VSGSSAPPEPPGEKSGQVLHDWVYAEQRLLGSFDVELLERHAVAQLARALNGRRLIAVVGSGVSNGYGQPSWSELLRNAVAAVEDAIKREREASAGSDEWLKDHPVLKAAVDALDALPKGKLDADAIPFWFEACENVLVALRRLKLKRIGDRDADTRREGRRAAAALRDRLRWQIKDGRGRIEMLLGRLLKEQKSGSPAAPVLKRLRGRLHHAVTVQDPPPPAADAFAGQFAHRIYERPEFREQIVPHLQPTGNPGGAEEKLKTLLRAQLGAVSEDGPDTRHLIDAALYLLPPVRLAAVLTKAEKWALLKAKGKAEEQTEASVRPAKPLERPNLPKHRDPLAVLLDECNVKRFLTTNYDDEIMRLLGARGFEELTEATPPAGEIPSPPSAAKSSRSRSVLMTASSERAEVMAYEAGSTAFLYDYGADTREHRPQILHLHGRAKTPGSWLVLSERDYRQRYARDDDDPGGCADDAMRLIFTANPLLFVGLGMSEPDILRPLRAFSDGVSRLCDRPAVAVLPAMAIAAKRTESQRLTLSRYGVYQLYYGHINRGAGAKPWTGPDPFMAILLAFQDRLYRRLNSDGIPLKDVPPESDSVEVKPTHLETEISDVEGETSGAAALRTIVRHLRVIDEISRKPDLTPSLLPSLRALNDGMKSVILTTFLTAWLANMAKRWTIWLEDWGSAPTPREPYGACKSLGDADGSEYTRHRTLLRDLDKEIGPEGAAAAQGRPTLREAAPASDRFFVGAPSPALEGLRDSLRSECPTSSSGWRRLLFPEPPPPQPTVRPPGRGRRIFYLLGERGTGRGHVFAAMRSPERFAQVCEWLGLVQGGTGRPDSTAPPPTEGIARIFFNLGLSHEVISTFDRLTWILESTVGLPADESASFMDDCRKLHGDRLGRLEHALRRLHEIGPDPSGKAKRVVVIMNHVSVFFDVDGSRKNAQVGRLFERLTSSDYDQAPIDFIFFVNERHLPIPLRKAAKKEKSRTVGYLRPARLAANEENGLAQRMEHSFGQKAANAFRRGYMAESSPAQRDRVDTYIHFLQRMRPATLAVRFFPRTAAALAYLGISKSVDSRCVTFADKFDLEYPEATRMRFASEESVLEFQIGVRDAFEARLAQAGGPPSPGAELAGDEVENLMLKVLADYQKDVDSDQKAPPSGRARVRAAAEAILEAGPVKIKPTARCFFDTIATAVGHNRYAMTVVLAAIDDMIDRRLPGTPENVVDLHPVRDFVERLRRNTVGRAPDTREEIAVKLVLENYRSDEFSALGKKLAVQVPGMDELGEVEAARLFDLQEKILVTLALIGQPVELGVLTGVETVATALQQVATKLRTPPSEDKKGDQLRTILEAMMNLLVRRCLVYRVAPKGPEDEAYPLRGHRFATHKAIRRHIFLQFKAPNIDYSQVDQLTVSLYATQPDDLPRPTAEGHRRVRNLIDQLSLFEKALDEPAHDAPDPYLQLAQSLDRSNHGEQTRQLRSARLRAAYGALRSIYSVGVVSRFSTYEHEGLETPVSGYFESHRLRVRWMLRLATRLDRPLESATLTGERGDLEKIRGTFHAEEIVWLFNECGVISLAQGRFSDAVALLGQASRIARDLIEKRDWGALHARIGVNRSIAQIERGRLLEAKEMLERVRDESDETPALRAIARGYLALICDLRGDQRSANAEYDKVISRLIEIGRYRSAAIFSVQRAECLQRLGGPHLEQATLLADQATSFAAKGGHEDIRHLAQLARIALEITVPGKELPVERRKTYDDQLAEVDAYARTMGAPRIICRVALVRSEFALQLGDYPGAARFAQAAMQIATRHDMELRKIGAMTLLGTAMFKLDLPEARTLLLRARDLSYHVDYLTQLKRIEAILS
jgi:tetratricopeptide (TPR) repeat protein